MVESLARSWPLPRFVVAPPPSTLPPPRSPLLRRAVKKVQPAHEALGWYGVSPTASLDPADAALHQQVMDCGNNAAPLYLQMIVRQQGGASAGSAASGGGGGGAGSSSSSSASAVEAAAPSSRELPLRLFLGEIRSADGASPIVFTPISYKVETGEPERLMVEAVTARSQDFGASAAPSGALPLVQGHTVEWQRNNACACLSRGGALGVRAGCGATVPTRAFEGHSHPESALFSLFSVQIPSSSRSPPSQCALSCSLLACPLVSAAGLSASASSAMVSEAASAGGGASSSSSSKSGQAAPVAKPKSSESQCLFLPGRPLFR